MLDKISKNSKLTFLASAVTGILVYFQIITRWLANPDGVQCGLFYRYAGDYTMENSAGRFGNVIIAHLKGMYINPTMIAITSILLMAISAALIVEIFQIKNSVWAMTSGMILVLAPSFMCTLTYYFCADSYTFSFFLAVLAMAFFHFQPNWKGDLAAGCCLLVSLTIYQAYLFVTATLCLLYLIMRLLENEETIKQILFRALHYGITAVVAAGGYLISFKIAQRLFHFEPMSERGFDKMGQISFSMFVDLLRNMYIQFFGYFFGSTILNNGWKGRRLLNIAFVVVLFLVVVAILRKKMPVKRMIWIAIAFLLIPFTCAGIILISPEIDFYILMCPAMSLLYIFVVSLVDCFSSRLHFPKIGNVFTGILSCYLLYILIIFAGIFQSNIQLNLNRTYALANRIVANVEEQIPNITEYTVLFYGDMKEGNYPDNYQQEMASYILRGTEGCTGMFWRGSTNSRGGWLAFLQAYLGVDWNLCTNDQAKEAIETEEFRDMGLYPQENSIRKIGNVVVIKLSE